MNRNIVKLSFCFICVLICVGFQEVVDGMNFMKICNNDSYKVRDIGVDVSYEVIPVFSESYRTFQLHLVVNWTLDFSSFDSGEIQSDGFAVHLAKINTKLNTSAHAHSISPTTPCISGEYYAWVTTSQTDVCSTENDASSACDNKPPNSCLCSLSTCDLVNNSHCHSTDLLLTNPNYFQTVPPTTRSLMYPIDFHEKYEFSIAPYFREFALLGYIVTQVLETDDCPKLLQSFNIDVLLSRTLCCDQGARTLVVHNITFSSSKPIFGETASSTTVEKTVTWLPPPSRYQPINYSIIINPQTEDMPGMPSPMHSEFVVVPFNEGDIIHNNNTSDDNCTYVPDYKVEMLMYNLVPGVSYLIQIWPRYDESQLEEWCELARCSILENFAAEIEDVCNDEYNFCDSKAKCELGIDENTGREAKCECSPGLTGDGLNVSFGEGCFELNECQHNLTTCSLGAVCVDNPAPNTGVNCSCSEGYYGDGVASGSGCQSTALLILEISLPLAVVLVVAIFLIVWYVKKKQRMKRNGILEQYLPDEKGIIASYENCEGGENEGPWDPTFGDVWEIDRKNINFGKVLGRGNYGIVHMAYLKMNDEANGKLTNDETAFRNGGFYNPVSPNENGGDHHNSAAENSTVVAVKSLQESNRNHTNLFNFLAEIAFMLNIGKHENIVQIYGCSTTEEPVYLITEYLQYGDLLHFLWDAREPTKLEVDPVYKVTERSLCTMARHVANGLTYLQSIRIIHGDIAARNILVGTDGICKISDFGLANDVYRYGVIKGHKERFVPFKWISPERMMAGEIPITYKSDVWSFGNLIYEMFTLGCPPHPGIQSGDLLDKLRAGYRMKKPRTCNDEVYDLMDKCWRWQATSRPRFNQIVKTLQNIMEHLQSTRNDTDLCAAVEELDRQQYDSEVNQENQTKDIIYANGNVALVENTSENQTRAM